MTYVPVAKRIVILIPGVCDRLPTGRPPSPLPHINDIVVRLREQFLRDVCSRPRTGWTSSRVVVTIPVHVSVLVCVVRSTIHVPVVRMSSMGG